MAFSSFSSPEFKVPELQLPGFQFWAGAFLGLVLLLIILDGLVSVPAGHVAVIYDRGRGVLHDELPEGLHLKIPFWQTSELFDTRLTTLNFSGPSQSRIQGLTKDGQSIGLDITIQYRIPAAKASEIYQTIGTDYASKVVLPESRKVIRDEVTAFDSTELFAEGKRKEASQQMADQLKNSFLDNHIELVDVVLRDVNFSEAYLNSIEEKQIAQQKIQKAQNDLARIEIEKQQKITIAEGEAEAIRVKGDELSKNPQVIQFELVQKIAPGIAWGILPDGVLPLLDLKELNKNE